MKAKTKAKVVNSNWDLKMYDLKRKLEENYTAAKGAVKFCTKAFFQGAGFATVLVLKRYFRL